ncbi:MAG: heme A synthase [Actinobacteria bacterium]|nr:heme A synthase [Actinomycetota bacterium]
MRFSFPTSLKDRPVRIVVWSVLIANIGITVTGALVRLTASGLGCPEWPLCTADSLVNTPEMGIHGVIEFGNRVLTLVLLIVTVFVLLVLWRMRRERRDLWRFALVLLLGIPLQAVIGGISVWTNLNPYVVGLHFVLSIAMTVVATILVNRVVDVDRISRFRNVSVLSWLVAAGTALTLMVGILTTGSGPHAGDVDAPRNGLDSGLLQHLHSWPAYLTLALVTFASVRSTGPSRRWFVGLVCSFAVQATLGIVQSRTGLPVALVALHVALAMVTTAVATAAVYRSATSGSIATAMKSAVK